MPTRERRIRETIRRDVQEGALSGDTSSTGSSLINNITSQMLRADLNMSYDPRALAIVSSIGGDVPQLPFKKVICLL